MASEITKTNSFYIANRDLRESRANSAADRRCQRHRGEMGPKRTATKSPNRSRAVTAFARYQRSPRNVRRLQSPITEDIIATQQGVADRFLSLVSFPKQIAIRDIVWRNTRPDPACHRFKQPEDVTDDAFCSALGSPARCCRSSIVAARSAPPTDRRKSSASLPEIPAAGAAQEQGFALRRNEGIGTRVMWRNFRPGRAARSAQCRRDRFRQYRQAPRSSRRPPARRSSMSPMSAGAEGRSDPGFEGQPAQSSRI